MTKNIITHWYKDWTKYEFWWWWKSYTAGDGIDIANGVISNTGILNDTTWTTTIVQKIRAWTEQEYQALQSHDANTIYHVY